ncbi:unnamed protein product [Urochloa humidicola]
MGFDNNKMTPAEEPFFGIVPGKASYPIGRVSLPVTIGMQGNYRTEWLHFEVADFKSSYLAILGRPMLARFMAIPNHTYLLLKMQAPNGVLTVRGDIKTSFECDSEAVRLAELSHQFGNSILVAEEAKKTPPEDLTIPPQYPTLTALQPTDATKPVSLGLDDPSKMALIGSSLTPK